MRTRAGPGARLPALPSGRSHSLGKSLSQIYHDRRFLPAASQALVQRHGSKQADKYLQTYRPLLPTDLGARGAGPGGRRAGGGAGGDLAWARRTGPGLSLAVPHSTSVLNPRRRRVLGTRELRVHAAAVLDTGWVEGGKHRGPRRSGAPDAPSWGGANPGSFPPDRPLG